MRDITNFDDLLKKTIIGKRKFLTLGTAQIEKVKNEKTPLFMKARNQDNRLISGGNGNTDVTNNSIAVNRPGMYDTEVLEKTHEGIVTLDNYKGFANSLKNSQKRFKELFRRKAFLHYYTGVGMDEMELVEAETAVNNLIEEYEK